MNPLALITDGLLDLPDASSGGGCTVVTPVPAAASNVVVIRSSTTAVRASSATTINRETDMARVSVLTTSTNATTVQCAPDVVSVNTPGPQGPPGDTDAAVLLATSGATINALRVIKLENDLAYVADSSTAADANRVVGISVTAASNPGDQISVRTDGEMNDAGWSWTPGAIFVGQNGVLTQTAPNVGFVLEVARARSATKIIVDIQNPFMRA